jgi:phosphate transport system permease protein
MSRRDRRQLLLSAAAGLSTAAVLCGVMDWTHPLTFAIWALLWFLLCSWLMARDTSSPVVATDRLVTTLVWLAGLLAVAVLVWMLVYVLIKGLPGLDAEFFTSDLSDVGPLDPGGGAFHAIVGTIEQMLVASVIAIPAALMTAVYLNEIKGRMSPVIRFVVDAMSGLPSIVAGLFIYTLVVSPEGLSLGWGYSGFAAGLALAILMIPIVTRAAEEMLRTVDDGLRESALALGSPQWRTALRIVLPTARAGLITASILGVARAIGETAPALLTAFGSDILNANPFQGAQSDLPLFVYQLLTKSQGNEAQLQRAWSGAVVLMLFVLALFTAARWIGNRGDRKRGIRR